MFCCCNIFAADFWAIYLLTKCIKKEIKVPNQEDNCKSSCKGVGISKSYSLICLLASIVLWILKKKKKRMLDIKLFSTEQLWMKPQTEVPISLSKCSQFSATDLLTVTAIWCL